MKGRATEQKQGGEGTVELLPQESHATASLISKCHQLLRNFALIDQKERMLTV